MPLGSCARFTPDHFLGDIVPPAVAGERAEPRWPLVNCRSIGKSWVMHSTRSRLRAALTGLWGPRVLWLAVGVAGAWSIGDALDGRSSAVRTTVMIGGWLRLGRRGGGARGSVGARAHGHAHGRFAGMSVLRFSVGSLARSRPRAHAFVACALVCSLLVGGADFGQQLRSGLGLRRRAALPAAPAGCRSCCRWSSPGWPGRPQSLARAVAAGDSNGSPVCSLQSSPSLLTWLLLPRFDCCRVAGWCSFRPASWCTTRSCWARRDGAASRHRGDRVGIWPAPRLPTSPDRLRSRGRDPLAVDGHVLLAPTKASTEGTALHVQVVHRRPDPARCGPASSPRNTCRVFRPAWVPRHSTSVAGDAAAEHVACRWGRRRQRSGPAPRGAAGCASARCRRRASRARRRRGRCTAPCTSPAYGSSAHTTSLTRSSVVDEIGLVADDDRRRGLVDVDDIPLRARHPADRCRGAGRASPSRSRRRRRHAPAGRRRCRGGTGSAPPRNVSRPPVWVMKHTSWLSGFVGGAQAERAAARRGPGLGEVPDREQRAAQFALRRACARRSSGPSPRSAPRCTNAAIADARRSGRGGRWRWHRSPAGRRAR